MHACLHKEVQSVPEQQTQKSPSRQNNEYRLGHFTTGHGVQFYLQYLLSDREQHAGCQFQRPALRVPSLKKLCTPGESCLQPHTQLWLSLALAFSSINKVKNWEGSVFVRDTGQKREGRGVGGTGGQMALSGSPPGPGWPRMWLSSATLQWRHWPYSR